MGAILAWMVLFFLDFLSQADIPLFRCLPRVQVSLLNPVNLIK